MLISSQKSTFNRTYNGVRGVLDIFASDQKNGLLRELVFKFNQSIIFYLNEDYWNGQNASQKGCYQCDARKVSRHE